MRLFILCFGVFLFACNPVKQVLRDPAKTTTVVNEYIKKYPILSDTVWKVIPGDSSVEFVFYADTAYIIDTMNVVKEKTITNTLTRVVKIKDTVYRTVTDRTFQQALQQQNAGLQVALDQRVKEVGEMKTSRNKYRSWFWILVAIIGVVFTVISAIKLKSPKVAAVFLLFLISCAGGETKPITGGDTSIVVPSDTGVWVEPDSSLLNHSEIQSKAEAFFADNICYDAHSLVRNKPIAVFIDVADAASNQSGTIWKVKTRIGVSRYAKDTVPEWSGTTTNSRVIFPPTTPDTPKIKVYSEGFMEGRWITIDEYKELTCDHIWVQEYREMEDIYKGIPLVCVKCYKQRVADATNNIYLTPSFAPIQWPEISIEKMKKRLGDTIILYNQMPVINPTQ